MSDILSSIRLTTDIGQPMILAECLRHGCGWRMYFVTSNARLIVDTCEQHPCAPVPCSNCGYREDA